MKVYHVETRQDGGWFIGRVLERPGITTQGRTLDDLLHMIRDAIRTMWNETSVQVELIIAPGVRTKPPAKRSRRLVAAAK